jgi:hypothetical protein
MAFSTGGFLDDAYTAMVFAPDGVLWGLRADGTQLVSLVPHEASKGLLPGDSVVELGAEADGVQRTPSGRIRVQRGNRTLGWLAASGDGLEPAAGAPQKSLASLPYGDWRLEIVWQDGEPLDVVVRHCVTGARAAKSAWSGSKDQLALQCVRDVALARDGALLLATEFGLIVRDAATGQVRSLYPDVSDARLLVNFPEGRLFVQAGETLGYQWNEAALQPFSARDSALPESSVQTGPWSWKASHRSALEQQVRVFHGKDARARRWQRASGGGWRFCDDCVRWIVRREVDEPPWLATDDGVWPVGRNLVRDPQRGELLGGRAVQHVRCPQGATWWWRGEGEGWRPMPAPGASPPRESAARADAPAEEFRVRNAALEVSYADGTLSLTPFDGPNQPVFTRRRLFCDCGDGVACWKGAIYVLVRGRCLLRRGLAQPGEITGCWCLPDPLPQDPPCELRGGADGLRLVVDFGAGRRQPAWDFAASPGVQPWRARTPELGKPAAQIGPFVWQRQVPQGLLAPAVARDAGRPPFKAVGPVAAGGFASQAVAEWWSGDRFAWDRVSDACMFGDGRAVLLSAAGPLIVELGDKSPPALTGFWPLPWFTSCETARDDHGRPLGVALSCPAGERLLSMDAGGTASIDPDPPAMPLCYRAAARLVSRAAAVPTGNRLQWTPWWAPVTRGLPATQEPILQSSLPQLPRELLLGDGQFRCDAAARAVEFAEGADSFWITFAPFSGPNGPETLVCLNQLDGGGQAEAGFLLRMAWRCPPHLDMLRPCGKLESVAVFREPGGSAENTFFGRARFNAAELQLSRAELPRVDPSRRIGGAVTLTAGRLDFGPRELFWGDEAQAPLEVKPADYPLWVRQGEGLSFAFDVLQGLSLGRGPEGRPQLALATRGGVLLADPAIAHGPTALSYPNVQLTLPCQPSGLIAASDASRVRHDASGQLWARFGPGLQVGKLAAGGWQFPASGWATELVPAGPFAVRFQSGKGMCVGDGPWHALSDDLLMPWDCHRKPLGSVLDVFYDADARALWVLDEHGLFKVLPDRLR